MSRVQLALNVSDIETAVDFYSKLFGSTPAKRRPGYANFEIAEPPLKLVLMENAEATEQLNHLGIEMESAEAVIQANQQLSKTGLPLSQQTQNTCCYALQDKLWVRNPSGADWEIYTVLEDSATFGTSQNSTSQDTETKNVKPTVHNNSQSQTQSKEQSTSSVCCT